MTFLSWKVVGNADVETTNGQELVKLPNVHPCRRRIIVTFDEEDTITDKHGTIEVIPCWKWFMEIDR